MVVVVAAALLAMAARHANRAVWEADESNYAGDSNSQDICVLAEAIPSMFFAALAGACCGPALNRAFPRLRRLSGRSTLAVLSVGPLLFFAGSSISLIPRLAGGGFWCFGIGCFHSYFIVQRFRDFHAEESTRGW